MGIRPGICILSFLLWGFVPAGCHTSSTEQSTSTTQASSQANGEGGSDDGVSRQKKKGGEGKSGGENEGLAGYLVRPESIIVSKISNTEIKVTAPAGTVVNTMKVSLGWISVEQYGSATEEGGKVTATLTVVASITAKDDGSFQEQVTVGAGGLTVSVGHLTLGAQPFVFEKYNAGQSGAVIDWDKTLENAGVDNWSGWPLGGCSNSQGIMPIGEGTSVSPYFVCTPDQLANLFGFGIDRVSHIHIGADLNMGAHSWQPILFGGQGFSGHIEGHYHEISDLSIQSPQESDLGFFGLMDGGEIVNLRIGGQVADCSSTCGVIAGVMRNSTLQNVHVVANVAVTGALNPQDIGSLAGVGQNIELLNVTANGYLDSANRVGGLFGNANGVEGNSVGFHGEIQSSDYAGGLFGVFTPSGQAFTNVYVYGTISSTNHAGAYAGRYNGVGDMVLPTSCYLNAEITRGFGETSFILPDVDGFLGSCYVNERVNYHDTIYPGSVINLTEQEVDLQSTFMTNGFDFEGVWRWDEPALAPYLDHRL